MGVSGTRGKGLGIVGEMVQLYVLRQPLIALVLSIQEQEEMDLRKLKLTALIRLEEYSEALNFITSSKRSFQDTVALERAYCCYRTDALTQGLDWVQGLESVDALHLKSQILYRLHQYHDCKALYAKLLKEDTRSEVKVNELAVLAAMDTIPETASLSKKSPELYEDAYNRACVCIAIGDLTSAEEYLASAKSMPFILRNTKNKRIVAGYAHVGRIRNSARIGLCQWTGNLCQATRRKYI